MQVYLLCAIVGPYGRCGIGITIGITIGMTNNWDNINLICKIILHNKCITTAIGITLYTVSLPTQN